MKFEVSRGTGLAGIHMDVSLDSAEFAPIWEEADRLNMTAVIDTDTFDVNAKHIQGMKYVLQHYKNVKLVAAHLLKPQYDQASVLREALSEIRHERLWYDIATLPWMCEKDPYPYTMSAQYIAMAKEIVGCDKLMWGSDVPAVLTRDSYEHLKDYPKKSGLFTEAELEKIMGGNAEQLFGL